VDCRSRVGREHESAESVWITNERVRVEKETEGLRDTIGAGFDDIGWASVELNRLQATRERLPD
jgi:hypothetical protein